MQLSSSPYSTTAPYYGSCADYSEAVLDRCLRRMRLGPRSLVVDVGAGTGRLAVSLAKRGLNVIAIEPSASMRQIGISQTRSYGIEWRESSAEKTGLKEGSVSAVFFAESFFEAQPEQALLESRRILVKEGWVCCLENQREREDPLQKQLVALIRQHLPSWSLEKGDIEPYLCQSGFCKEVICMEEGFLRLIDSQTELEAWRTCPHLCQEEPLLAAMRELLDEELLEVPYTTRAVFAQLL